MHQKATSLIPNWTTCLGCRFAPPTDQCFSLSVSKINKNTLSRKKIEKILFEEERKQSTLIKGRALMIKTAASVKVWRGEGRAGRQRGCSTGVRGDGQEKRSESSKRTPACPPASGRPLLRKGVM